MNKIIKLTEDDLSRIVKRVVSEQPKPANTPWNDTDYANYNAKYGNNPTASWERKPSSKMPMKIKMSGTESFDTGKSDVKKDSPSVKKAVNDLKQISNSGGGDVTVNGSSSRTVWGQYAANSKEAYDRNLSLAKTRRDNMLTYLKSLNLKGVTFKTGRAEVSDSDRVENQNITLDITGSQMVNIDPKGDIGDNTRTVSSLYPKKTDSGGGGGGGSQSQSRVATRIPTKHVNELKRVIYNWGKKKGLQLPITDKIV